MNIDTFFEHYNVTSNPFRAEEARQDTVFSQVETVCRHPDFTKIRGDYERPATSIVFGERGSGKTAIRMQIEDCIREHNREHSEKRCLAMTYDELNPILDRFSRSMKKSSAGETLKEFRLVDHIDAMFSSITPRIVDQVLGDTRGRPGPIEITDDGGKQIRKLNPSARSDLMMLQLCYDRPAAAEERAGRLKKALRHRGTNTVKLFKFSAIVMAVIALAAIIWFLIAQPNQSVWLWYVVLIALCAVAVGLAGRFGWLWWKANSLARDLAAQLRVMDRSATSYRHSIETVGVENALAANIPRNESDDPRYEMFDRLLNVIRPFGYQSIIVLVDRVDEPTMINGEPELMRPFIWPLFNNKFLQQDDIAIKLLLPLELKHLLNRETGDFFREARLDKQNLIERLTWSGATLYDLCTARLNACRPEQQEDMSLTEMFDDSVSYQDIIDALDQMQQPRDAFKFLYTVIQEHCSNVPQEQPVWQIPRPILDSVRKQQVERVSGMLRGIRPA